MVLHLTWHKEMLRALLGWLRPRNGNGFGESTAVPMECSLLFFFRAFAKVLEVFLKVFRISAGTERPGTAKTSTKARSRRYWATRKGKRCENIET